MGQVNTRSTEAISGPSRPFQALQAILKPLCCCSIHHALPPSPSTPLYVAYTVHKYIYTHTVYMHERGSSSSRSRQQVTCSSANQKRVTWPRPANQRGRVCVLPAGGGGNARRRGILCVRQGHTALKALGWGGWAGGGVGGEWRVGGGTTLQSPLLPPPTYVARWNY